MKSIIHTAQALMLALFVFVAAPAYSADSDQADIKALKAALAKRIPQAADATIKTTPLKGLYEVVSGGQVMYMDKNARYIIDGNLFDMEQRRNLTDETRGGLRLDAVNQLGEENMLVYKPKGEVKHTITVFTDIYCPYCQRLHQEMDDYMNNGIKVRYIFVPFKGAKSVNTSISVWCADDQNKAMDKAKAGEEVEPKKCDNPVSKHQMMANQIGIRGTPAIMLEDGQLMPGYVPSSKLIQQLNTTP